ncbi:MFS transporter [Bacillus sp. JJ722]|uniref:MFS transporter n=1 Tax=Bacillus sp. JJ722 TaxID=3122973 RepID=UPI002FFDAC03
MRWISLMFLFLFALIAGADKQVIGYAADPLIKEFDLSSAQWGIVGSSFFWLFLVTSLVGGTWSDRLGTTKMIFIVLGGVSLMQFSSFAIVGLPMLILYRVLLGAFEGPYAPSAMNFVTQKFPAELRGLGMAVFLSGASLGGIISAPILVSLIERYSWRWTFVILGFVSLAILVAWYLFEHVTKKKQKYDTPKPQKLKWSNIAPVLQNPACFLTIALSAATYWLIVWMALWAPIYLTKVVKVTPMQMAYSISVVGVTSVVLVLLISSLSDYIFKKNQNYRKSRVWVASISTLIGGLALAVIPLLGNSFLWILVALCVAKGSTYVNISMSSQVMIRLMPERAGFMSSILSLGNNITQLVAPIVTGIIIQTAGTNLELGFKYSIYVMVGFFILTAILNFIFVKPDDENVIREPELLIMNK